MFKSTQFSTVIRVADGAVIPRDEGNRDYREVLAWLAQGNSLLPADAPAPVVHDVVSMRQARLALLGAGLLSTVDASIASMAGPAGDAARIEWEYATEVRRDSALVEGMGAVLNLTKQDIDALFETAAAIL